MYVKIFGCDLGIENFHQTAFQYEKKLSTSCEFGHRTLPLFRQSSGKTEQKFVKLPGSQKLFNV